ncbi:hypothetical protein BDV95DRAFT_487767 [Massariosphaeria phaeospora]|uniref:DUF159 domain protein n=1 Tax=Massariosphaeria phaeospora TaxID=100035 RepID=A0A7C8MCP4_9PLEO|nr:hypothetical protein BDV95DRAFT_487767 [Massariosphaeria phaeospora]
MCGRYALALRPSEVRQQLEQGHMHVDEAPDDDQVRHTYNFAPGNHGLVFRADGPEYGGSKAADKQEQDHGAHHEEGNKTLEDVDATLSVPADGSVHDTKYKLQAMKWGLIPFWTKRNPDYGSMMKTINCRDDSLIEDRGMWTSMKKKKRCIVVAQGFYEWLKKNNGKEKIPHFTKRKDGQLMCFAGLWDCVQYEGEHFRPCSAHNDSTFPCPVFHRLGLTDRRRPDSDEQLYTYTIITTDSNKQLNFLHDRMPVILENGSEAIRIWLDPTRTEWSKELQMLLKPFEGELECYPVSKDVGKVGNNSPSFVVPVNSAENKNNIANFFGNQRKAAKAKADVASSGVVKREVADSATAGVKVEHGVSEGRGTTDRVEGTENNAPMPLPAPSPSSADGASRGVKRERSEGDDGDTADGAPQRKQKMTAKPSPSKADGSRKITSFFSK